MSFRDLQWLESKINFFRPQVRQESFSVCCALYAASCMTRNLPLLHLLLKYSLLPLQMPESNMGHTHLSHGVPVKSPGWCAQRDGARVRMHSLSATAGNPANQPVAECHYLHSFTCPQGCE